MASVGSLNLKMVVNPAQWNQGLSKAASMVDRLARKVSSFDPAKGIGKLFGSLGKAPSALLSGFKGLAESIPFVGGAFGALPTTVGGFFDLVRDGIGEVNALTTESMKLGLSISDIAGLQMQSGDDWNKISKGLFNYQAMLGDAAAGSEDAQKKIAGLGITGEMTADTLAERAAFVKNSLRPGAGAEFDAQYLMRGDLGEQLRQIADKTKGMTDPAARARMMGIFGKADDEMLPIMAKGREGFDKAAGIAKRQGLDFGSNGAADAKAAGEAIKQAEMAVKGLKVQLAVQLAPWVKAFVEWFNEAGITGKNMAETIVTGLRGIAHTVAFIIDTVVYFKVAWDVVLIAVEGVALGVVGLFEILGDGLSVIPGLNGIGEGLANSMRGTRQWLQRDIAEVAAGLGKGIGEATQGVNDFFDTLESRSKAAKNSALDPRMVQLSLEDTAWKAARDERIAQAVKEKKEELFFARRDTLVGLKHPESHEASRAWASGRLAWMQQTGEFNPAAGSSDYSDWFESRRLKLRKTIAAEEAATRRRHYLQEQADKASQDMRSPLDKFRVQMGEFREMLQIPTIPGGDVEQMQGRAVRDLMKSLPSDMAKAPGAMLEGSTAAYSTIRQYQEQGAVSVQERIRQTIEQLKNIEEQNKESLKKIADALKDKDIVGLI